MKKTATVVLLLGLVGPAAGQDSTSNEATFRRLNDGAITIYQDAKRRFLAAADPIVVAGFESVLVRRRGSEQRLGQTPSTYQLLKSIDHGPRSVWAALRPAIEGLDRDDAWRGKLATLRPLVAAVLATLPRAKLSEAARERGSRTLRACLDQIDRSLAQGPPGAVQLEQDMRTFAPAMLADAAEAAQIRIDAIDRELRPWWQALTPAERQQAVVVVLGAKTSRPGNLAYSYFVNLLGPAEDGHRVIYAESIFEEKDADGLLATLLTDRRLSQDFFADERRMERDLLADGAEARLLQIFGRLGTP